MKILIRCPCIDPDTGEHWTMERFVTVKSRQEFKALFLEYLAQDVIYKAKSQASGGSDAIH